MARSNPIREKLTSGQFCYMIEMVASASAREAQLLETASELAQISELAGAGITSYAGGSKGHNPIRIGAAARARGLTPNVHLTCVNKDRLTLHTALRDIAALGIENVFAISGDYPKGASPDSVTFDMDSVQLVELINEIRKQTGTRFFVSVAVSPFKYTEADCVYQYLKLEKKIAAGADFAITQLGFDMRKNRELMRYLKERGLKTPVMGNVYVLGPKASEKMAMGEPPGCWASPELVERIQEEAKAPDKGSAARLERAAQMTAVLKGLGFAGAYIGGISKAENVRFVIKRSQELEPRWQEFEEQLNFGKKGGFYLYETPIAPAKSPGFGFRASEVMHSILFSKKEPMRSLLTGVVKAVDHYPAAAHGLERLEFAFKSPAFGCQACGNCVLPNMEYVCPQTCPKGMRNGPCGGTFNGKCEVVDKPCIWVEVYDRAKAEGDIDELKTFIPAPNRGLTKTSSWINYFLDRDVRPESVQPLVQIEGYASPLDEEAVAAVAGGVKTGK